MTAKKRFVALGMLLLGLTCVSSAGAFFVVGDPAIHPASPHSDQEIFLRLDFHFCFFPETNPDGQNDHLDPQGEELHLYIVGTSAEVCIGTPPPGPTVDYPLGSLTPGSYTMSIYQVPPDTVFPVDPGEFDAAATVSFGVSEAPAVIPFLNWRSATMLALVLALFGLWTVRVRESA